MTTRDEDGGGVRMCRPLDGELVRGRELEERRVGGWHGPSSRAAVK